MSAFNTRNIERLDYKIVVARFNEDVDWLVKYAPKVVVQNKGDEASIPAELVPFTNHLPNIGLDQHSHLEYIIQNYDTLPEIVIFTQANLEDHRDVHEPHLSEYHFKQIDSIHRHASTMSTDEILMDMIKQVHLYGCTHNAKSYVAGEDILARAEMIVTAPLEQSAGSNGMTLGEWFEKNLGQAFPDPQGFRWFKNAIFGASKKYILSRPKSFYQGIKDQITMCRQDILHFIERSWYYMLNLDKKFAPHSMFTIMLANQHIFKTLDNIVIESGQGFVEGSLFFFGNQDMQYNETFMHKQVNLFNLAKKAKNILEIGFNAGHSTALMLLANPTSRIMHFDLREHAYGERCYEFLKSVFGAERFIDFVAGDSRVTVPSCINSCPTRFDLIHIDGGHTDIVAYSDIVHCQKYAAPDNYVIVDDYDMPNLKALTDLFVRRGVIQPQEDMIVEDYCGKVYHYIGRFSNLHV